jgi:hypothetical protein
MADDKIRIRFAVEFETVPSEYPAADPTVAVSEVIQTQLNHFITRLENEGESSASASPYIDHIHYVGFLGKTHVFFGVMEIPIFTPLGHLFFEHGRYSNGIWVLSAVHKGAITAILNSLLYFPDMGSGIDAIYSILLTSIAYDDKNYTVEFPDDEATLYLRGPGGGTVRMFDEIELAEEEILPAENEPLQLDKALRSKEFVPLSGPGGGTVRYKKVPKGRGKKVSRP